MPHSEFLDFELTDVLPVIEQTNDRLVQVMVIAQNTRGRPKRAGVTPQLPSSDHLSKAPSCSVCRNADVVNFVPPRSGVTARRITPVY
jgi:hypothetical protein